MSSKTPASTGVKKRIVKTVRKGKTTPKSKTTIPETALTPETSLPETSHPETSLPETTLPETTIPETTLPEPSVTETPIPETTPPAAVSEDALANAVTEPETAVTETPVPMDTETAVTEPEPVETATKPSDSDTKPATKTIIRVRKVVKKKVVAKRVPKASVAAKVEEGVQNPNPNPSGSAQEEEKKILQSSQPENPSSDAVPEEVPETGKLDSGDGGEIPIEEDKEEGGEATAAGDEMKGVSERRRRRKTEIFIGGLDRDATEEDIRKVFGKVGEIVEVRMMMDGQSGKNKGYGFLRYAEAAQAKKAVSEFVKVEVCGKLCGAAALEGNDTIFLGNIDKKWKKEDVNKLLQEIGIEKIDTVTVVGDPNNADVNRGFAFLELETNRDAQNAYKKLQKRVVFGKGRNIKVAWAEPLNDPDAEEMQKVKSVYVEGLPSSWDESKVRASFKKFGEIERVVLARNMQSAKRKDFAFVNYTTREAALLCIESFDKEELTDNGSKVSVKVSLAKPVQKGKQNKGGSKSSNMDHSKEKPKAVQRDTKVNVPSNKGKSFKGVHSTSGGDKKSSTNRELLNVLREQATWKQGQLGYARDSTMQDYTHALHGGKRSFSALGDDALYSDLRGYPRARHDSSYPATSSRYGEVLHGMADTSLPYYHHPSVGYATGALYGAADPSSTHQMRQGAPPYGSNLYSRY